MNLFQLQERIKDFSKDQLVREMQQPSGAVPPFLVLSELQRRTRMEKAFQADQAQGQQSTVAQDAIAAAGVPQGGIADMARAMAPQTDMAGNTGAMPVQNMYGGGEVKRMEPGGEVEGPNTAALRQFIEISRALSEMQARSAIMQEQLRRRNAAAADRFSFLDADLPVIDEFSGLPSYMTEPGTLADIEPTIDTSEGYDDFDYQRALDEAARMRELNAIPFAGGEYVPPPVPDDFDYQNARYNEAEANRMRELNAIPFAGGSLADVAPIDAREDEGQYTEALRSDIERQRRRLTPADYQSRGETDPLDPRSPSYVPPFDTSGAYANLLGAPSTIEAMFGDVGPLQGPMQPEPYSPAGQGAPLSARPDILMDLIPEPDVTPFELPSVDPDLPSGYALSRFMFPFRDPEAERIRLLEAERTRVVEPTVAVDEFSSELGPNMVPEGTADVVELPPLQGPNLPPGGMPAPSTTPVAPTTPPGGPRTSGTGGAGARAAGAADADKWLALAQFGLGLMASQAPTLGGAIGEAGTAALSQLRESQKEAYERDLAERTLAARSASRSGNPSFGNLISLANARINAAQAELERLNMDGITDLEKAIAEGRGDEFRSATADLLDANNLLRSLGPALTGGASLSDVEIDLTQ